MEPLWVEQLVRTFERGGNVVGVRMSLVEGRFHRRSLVFATITQASGETDEQAFS